MMIFHFVKLFVKYLDFSHIKLKVIPGGKLSNAHSLSTPHFFLKAHHFGCHHYQLHLVVEHMGDWAIGLREIFSLVF